MCSSDLTHWIFLTGKVNAQSNASDHESPYNVRCSTMLGFNLDFGYSRYQDSGTATHAWVLWHDNLEEWQMKIVVDFLLNIVGYQCFHNSDGLNSGQWVQNGHRWVPTVPRPPPPLPPSPLASENVLVPAASVSQPLADRDMVVQGASVDQIGRAHV